MPLVFETPNHLLRGVSSLCKRVLLKDAAEPHSYKGDPPASVYQVLLQCNVCRHSL